MRRRRGGGAAPAEACGVWLDTAELKRGPARPLSAKLRAPTRDPERRQRPVLLPQPGTRQSTIPSFFRPHTDERDKENSGPTPCTPDKDCEDPGAPLAACPVKILALPQLEEPPGAEQGLQGTSQPWKTPVQLQVEPQRQSRASPGAGGDSWCCSLSQGREHGGIIPHRNKSRLFPGETASGSRNPQPCSRENSGVGFAGAENTNPAPGAAPRGVWCSPQSLGPAQPLRELFCQDSQGNRVIAHRARALGDRDRALGDRDRALGDRDRALGDRDRALGDSCSPRQQQQELGSQCLFTQDSQGNRVIKHW